MSTTMAKLYIVGALVLICAVFVVARNTYRKEDAYVDEEINALVRVLLDPLKRTETSVESDENGDEEGDGQVDSGTDGEDKDIEGLEQCMVKCKAVTKEDLCKCDDEDCVPEDCHVVIDTGNEDVDDDLDEDDAIKRWFRCTRRRSCHGRPGRRRRHRRRR